MIQYDSKAYDTMLGNISQATVECTATCMSQCTGCMCNCKCSCSGGVIADVEWEDM
ncbi:Cys-rich radical SAM target, FibroRumin family [Lachnospiraceae bacterium C10]|nr:Cys-rich radical SAM target, FibroRumin family [Lachnospiraceae bacterium C10]